MGFGEGSADMVRAIGGFLSALGLFLGLLLKYEEYGKKKRQAKMLAIPPSATTSALQSNPFSVDPSITGKLLEANVSLARVGWDMDDLRKRLDTVRAERDEVAADARRTASTLVATQSQLMGKQKELNSARAKLYTLEQATAQWKAIAEERQREIDELTARLERVPTGRPPPR